jgi:uncharacterized membrane protein
VVAERRSNETGRVEAFSDGVFAIAITLLILEIHVPKGLGGRGLADAVLGEWPSYAAFLTSFLTIGIMWINHHRLFTLIERANTGLLVLNLYLLMGVTIVPFPTAMVAEYLGEPGERLAAVLYAANGLNISLGFWGLWMYCASAARKPRLLNVPADSAEVKALKSRYRFGPLFYVVAVGLAFLNATVAMVYCGALALFFALPPRVAARRE